LTDLFRRFASCCIAHVSSTDTPFLHTTTGPAPPPANGHHPQPNTPPIKMLQCHADARQSPALHSPPSHATVPTMARRAAPPALHTMLVSNNVRETMKRKRAKSLLDKTILDLGDALADLVFEAQLLIHTYKTVRSGETISFDAKRKVHTHHSIGDWWNSISAEDLTQKRGTCHFYVGARKGDKQSITDRFPSTLNAQFRWLLVSGYEAYERFLLKLYAELGFCDRNLWRCADFGNRYHIADISSLKLDDFRQRVRECPELHPDKIRNLLGLQFSVIQRCENKNSIVFGDEKMTYRDYVDLIATMRHIIVHEQSQVEPEEFFRRIKKKWNRNDDLSHKLKTLIVHNDFKHSPDGWEIWLAQKSPIFQKSCTQMDGPLRTLLERLATHACLIYGEAIRHFDQQPFWKD
jgi:hypothetical protein